MEGMHLFAKVRQVTESKHCLEKFALDSCPITE